MSFVGSRIQLLKLLQLRDDLTLQDVLVSKERGSVRIGDKLESPLHAAGETDVRIPLSLNKHRRQ